MNAAILALVVALCAFGADETCGGAVNRNKPILTVSIYRVLQDGAEIDWHASAQISACELAYGPLSEPLQLQVLPNFLPDRHTFTLSSLGRNTTYRFRMVCYDQDQRKMVSNSLNFTTGEDVGPMRSIVSSEPRDVIGYPSSHRITKEVVKSSRDHHFPTSMDTERTASSNVLLGAVCGIVGFLIINITVVMVVRRYSQWQLRRRRILHIQENDYEGLAYFPDGMD